MAQPTLPVPNPDQVLAWRREGLSVAEIGRRLGVSADVLNRMLADAGATPDPAAADDNEPNAAPVR